MARKEKKEAKIEIKVWQPYLLIYTHLWYHHTHAASKIDNRFKNRTFWRKGHEVRRESMTLTR